MEYPLPRQPFSVLISAIVIVIVSVGITMSDRTIAERSMAFGSDRLFSGILHRESTNPFLPSVSLSRLVIVVENRFNCSELTREMSSLPDVDYLLRSSSKYSQILEVCSSWLEIFHMLLNATDVSSQPIKSSNKSAEPSFQPMRSANTSTYRSPQPIKSSDTLLISTHPNRCEALSIICKVKRLSCVFLDCLGQPSPLLPSLEASLQAIASARQLIFHSTRITVVSAFDTGWWQELAHRFVSRSEAQNCSVQHLILPSSQDIELATFVQKVSTQSSLLIIFLPLDESPVFSLLQSLHFPAHLYNILLLHTSSNNISWLWRGNQTWMEGVRRRLSILSLILDEMDVDEKMVRVLNDSSGNTSLLHRSVISIISSGSSKYSGQSEVNIPSTTSSSKSSSSNPARNTLDQPSNSSMNNNKNTRNNMNNKIDNIRRLNNQKSSTNSKNKGRRSTSIPFLSHSISPSTSSTSSIFTSSNLSSKSSSSFPSSISLNASTSLYKASDSKSSSNVLSSSSFSSNNISSSVSSNSSLSASKSSSKVLTMYEWDVESSQWTATYLIEMLPNSTDPKVRFLAAHSTENKEGAHYRRHNSVDCAREHCEISGNDRTSPIWWLAPIITFLVPVAIILLVSAFFLTIFRRQYAQSRFSKGPYKIILTPTDFVFPQLVDNLRVDDGMETMLCCWLQQLREFGGPAAALPAAADKPDLLKGSIGSLQGVRSLGTDSSAQYDVNVMDRKARYNGDLVQMKPLVLQGNTIELKSRSVDILLQLQGLRHENLNPFIGFLWDPSAPALVWEFCCRGSLEDVLVQDEIKLDWTFRLSLLTDLVRGMRYLHSVPHRFHGNLTSRNCVIDARWVLKITDYALSSFYDSQNVPIRQKTARELLWTAPELLRDPGPRVKGSQPADVYSFGIIIQEVVVRGEPFCMLSLSPEDIIEKLKTPPPLIRPSVSKGAAPPEAINIMRQCWAEPPDMRPDFNQVNDLFKTLNQGRKVNFVDTMFQMLEKYSNNLEDLIRERTEQLDIEKKKTEQLLNRMLPSSVADKLKLGMPVDPEEFREVTIYFSDIVGFTTISAYSTPFEVVDLLNDLYTCFDATINAYNVYKVETIGDAYMVVGGLPVRIPDHADQIATMALDLLHHSGRFKIRHLPYTPLRLRIGLHTGPCCAGVVGLTMPRYCLFGDTVNTASRLESTGASWRIHLSAETKEKLDLVGAYQLEYRGETELKGKGKMPTYWLLGKTGFHKELPVPPPIGLDESLILYGRTGPALSPSIPHQLLPTSTHPCRSPSGSFSSDHLPHRSPRISTTPRRQLSQKSSSNCKILSQILSLDSTIDESNPRPASSKKYKYMKQNTFDSCFYIDMRDGGIEPSAELGDGFHLSPNDDGANGKVNVGEKDKGDKRDTEKFERVSCEVPGAVGVFETVGEKVDERVENNGRHMSEKVVAICEVDKGRPQTRTNEHDNQNSSICENFSTNPNITINNVDSNALDSEHTDRAKSPCGKESSPFRDEINGMNRPGNNFISDKSYSTIEESSEEDRTSANNQLNKFNEVNTLTDKTKSNKDCSICKNSYIISHISNNSSPVFSDNSHICGDTSSNSSSNFPNFNLCDISENSSNNISCNNNFSDSRNNVYISKCTAVVNSSPKNMSSRNSFSGSTNTSPNNIPLYVFNNSSNMKNTKSSSFNNDSDNVSSHSSPSNGKSCATVHKTSNIPISANTSNSTFSNISSNTLSVNNLKRFNKCKSIDTSIDEIKYDLVGVSFLNPTGSSSRSNTNISTICNVTGGGVTSTTNGKRKFSIGTGNAASGVNDGCPLADLSKPYNLYRCLNQGNKYLKRQYSVDKPTVSEAVSKAESENKSVVKIQIHRE